MRRGEEVNGGGAGYAEKENQPISVKCPYTLKENVDVQDHRGLWQNGEIVEIRRNELKIHYTGRSRQHDFRVDSRSPRVQKQWTGAESFRLNNRLDIQDKSGNWYEAVIIDILPSYIVVADKDNPSDRDTLHESSPRIAPVGKYSEAFGRAKYEQLSLYLKEKASESASSLRVPLSEIREEKPIQKSAIHTTLRERELQFTSKLVARGFQIKEVMGDGNCLFRAISDQLYGSETHHEEIRRVCMDYIELEKDFFCQYIVGGLEAFGHYVERKRLSGVWGDDLEIEALTEIYGVPIEIYAYSDRPMRTFHEGSAVLGGMRKVMLSYHGESHYNSIVPLGAEQAPIFKTAVGEIEAVALENTKLRSQRRVEEVKKTEEKEEEKAVARNIAQSRANFEEYGSRNMESAFLEALCAKEEEKEVEEAKRVSERTEIDRDYTQIAIETSRKEMEEREKAIMNEAILASIKSQLTSIPASVRTVMVAGYSYDEATEAFQVVGDHPDLMINYLLDKSL